MNRNTWNHSRAIVFARGLYHVASIDGLNSREAAMIKAFCAHVGVPIDTVFTDDPFDYAEAAQVLDSTWLRRTMIQAARLMVCLDGEVTAAERDALRSIGSALSVGERVALAEVPMSSDATDPNDASALVDWISTLAIDHISWDDIAQNAYFWAFPHPTHPIQAGAELLVNRSQTMICRVGDTVCDVLGPGDYEVSPAALPGLAQRRNWTDGPVEADLVFLRAGPSRRLRWGTATATKIELPGHGAVPLRAYGRFTTRFCEPTAVSQRFLRQGIPTDEEVEQRLRRIIAGRFAQVFGDLSDMTIARLNNLDVLCAEVRQQMDGPLRASGLQLARFEIENLTGPLELGLHPMSKRTQNLTKVARRFVSTQPDESPTEEFITCSECAVRIPAGARFCSGCGTPSRCDCTQCGVSLPLAARFCSHCGAAQ
ncbi:MAG: tellurite resistance protein [Bradymonadia bacterium]|jgi:tellurite resistance protein